MSDGRKRPGWFLAAQEFLRPIIDARGSTSKGCVHAPTEEGRVKLSAERKKVWRAMEKAKESWLLCLVERINGMESNDNRRPITLKYVWTTIREM
jgi:hypothetical protein